jgi:serine/threonine protein kinase
LKNRFIQSEITKKRMMEELNISEEDIRKASLNENYDKEVGDNRKSRSSTVKKANNFSRPDEIKAHASTIKFCSEDFILNRDGRNFEDRYQIIENSSIKGSSTKIQTVKELSLDEERIMKEIAKTSDQKEGLEQFHHEVSILKKLDHPNIVKAYDLFESKDSYVIITEKANKGDLFEYIEKSKRLSEREASIIMRQILCALAHCHSRGIVHRDVKPENVVIH